MAAATKWNVFANEGDVPAAWREKLRVALQDVISLFSQEQWQPWSFRFENGWVELFLGNGMDEASDPDERETIIRCGGALQAFKLSLRRQGCHCRVNLFPVLDQPRLIARILIGEAGKSAEPEQMVFNEMMSIPRNVRNTGDSLISGATLDFIQGAVASERCWLEIAQCQRSREQLLELAAVRGRWPPKMTDARNRLPLMSSIPKHKRGRRGGWQRFSLGMMLRPSAAAFEIWDESDNLEASGTFAVIKTKTDNKHGWIATGQTKVLLLQTAGKSGVACSFFDDAVRRASIRHELRTSIGHKGFGQVIVQLRAVNPSIFQTSARGGAAIPARNYI